MKEIIIASPFPEQLADFSRALAEVSGWAVAHANSAAATKAAVARPTVQLLVVDARINEDGGKQLILDTLMVNALATCVVLGDTPDDEFHENMEGLGVLMQLPPLPLGEDARNLWQRFQALNAKLQINQP